MRGNQLMLSLSLLTSVRLRKIWFLPPLIRQRAKKTAGRTQQSVSALGWEESDWCLCDSNHNCLFFSTNIHSLLIQSCWKNKRERMDSVVSHNHNYRADYQNNVNTAGNFINKKYHWFLFLFFQCLLQTKYCYKQTSSSTTKCLYLIVRNCRITSHFLLSLSTFTGGLQPRQLTIIDSQMGSPW